MSCYTRHLVDLLAELGYEDSKDNRKRLDKAVRSAIGAEDLHCPEVWKEVNARRETLGFRESVARALKG